MLEFKKITIEDKNIIKKYIGEKSENSETNFTNLFIWADFFSTRYTIIDDVLAISNISPSGNSLCFFPKGEGNVEKCLLELYDYFKARNMSFCVTNATKDEAELFSKVFKEAVIEENRDFEDYVYLRESLVQLSGKKLHAKKNHLNKFKKLYPDYEYRELTEDDFENCMALARKLIMTGENSDDSEILSMEKLFCNYAALGLKGAVLKVQGNTVAFTVGEKQTENCAIIHIEKADTAYEGSYAAINNFFVSNTMTDFEFINREEDMGLEGLRKAKMSYRPLRMIIKYKCTAK